MSTLSALKIGEGATLELSRRASSPAEEPVLAQPLTQGAAGPTGTVIGTVGLEPVTVHGRPLLQGGGSSAVATSGGASTAIGTIDSVTA